MEGWPVPPIRIGVQRLIGMQRQVCVQRPMRDACKVTICLSGGKINSGVGMISSVSFGAFGLAIPKRIPATPAGSRCRPDIPASRRGHARHGIDNEP
jgi:hypothetical protein